MNRKIFLKKSAGAAIGIGILPKSLHATSRVDPEPLPASLVKEFVVAGHKELNKVKQMLGEYPNLLNSSYDWGNGDFEEAIEGAGHLGNREVASYLLDQGARVNLFVLTMLGEAELVIPVLEAFPALLKSKGAHGFTLLHHANVGGEKSAELKEYLTEKGLRE